MFCCFGEEQNNICQGDKIFQTDSPVQTLCMWSSPGWVVSTLPPASAARSTITEPSLMDSTIGLVIKIGAFFPVANGKNRNERWELNVSLKKKKSLSRCQQNLRIIWIILARVSLGSTIPTYFYHSLRWQLAVGLPLSAESPKLCRVYISRSGK